MRIANYANQRAGSYVLRCFAGHWPFALLALAVALLPKRAAAEYAINLPPPASGLAQEVYDLHTLILWICFAIFIVVLVPMFVALVYHRKSTGHQPATFHENHRAEILWTVIPTLILVGMAWPATRLVIAMKDTSKEELTVKVTGLQWKWEYEYLGDDIRFMSTMSTPQDQIAGRQAKGEHYLLEVDKPLVVPTGKKVRLVLTSSDVIHSWWVPALGVKQDAIPCFIRDAWFTVDKPGTYRGQCAELCGIGHGFMPTVVMALAPEEFAAWRAEQKTLLAAASAVPGKTYDMAELKVIGEKVYATNCQVCHQANGAGIPPAFPALDKSKIALGPKPAHIDIVVHGKPGTAMAAFGKQLSDLDIAAVVAYERNHWSNATGDVVQPDEVAARRK